MIRKRIFFILLFLGCFFASHLGFARTPDRGNDHIEIFVDGKKYSSFYDYRHERLVKSLQKMWPSFAEEDANKLVERILSEYSARQLARLTTEQFQIIVEDMQGQAYAMSSEESQKRDIEQMEEMLKDYFEERHKKQTVDINADKIKTIILKTAPSLHE